MNLNIYLVWVLVGLQEIIYTNCLCLFLRRASPDGQSFRSSIEEKPLKKRVPGKTEEDSDDEDYENVSSRRL